MRFCILCGKRLRRDDVDVCRTCFCALSSKYPKYKDFKEVIEWHKENLKEIEEE